MNISYRVYSNVLVVSPEIEVLDITNANEFREEVTMAIRRTNTQDVVIDMGKIAFMDSLGIGRLISLLRSINKNQGDLKVCSLSKTVRSIFEIVRLQKIIGIFTDADEAVRSFNYEQQPASV